MAHFQRSPGDIVLRVAYLCENQGHDFVEGDITPEVLLPFVEDGTCLACEGNEDIVDCLGITLSCVRVDGGTIGCILVDVEVDGNLSFTRILGFGFGWWGIGTALGIAWSVVITLGGDGVCGDALDSCCSADCDSGLWVDVP